MGTPGAWKADAISATEQLLTLTPGSSGQQRWKDIGLAKAGTQSGWLALDLRGDPIRPDTLNDLCCAANGGPDVATAYPIETFRHVDGVLLLKEPPALPADSRTVWVRTTSLRLLAEKLLAGLRESGPTPIADAFAAGRLATDFARGIPDPPGLVGAQADAYRGCRSPGVRLVWGPPGSGKTKVLARAIEDLINAGQRVLLVSTANVAVDNALHAVVRAMRPRRGTVVRVGPPQLAEIANNPDVQLQQLAAAASREVDQRLRAIERELAELDDSAARLTTLSALVGEFTPAAYRAATGRIENGRQHDALTREIADAETRWETTTAHAASRRAAARHARDEADRVAGARHALRTADELARQLRDLDVQDQGKRAELTSAQLRLNNATGWLATRKARRALNSAAANLAGFERLAAEHRPRLAALVATHRANAGPITAAHLAKLDAELRRTHEAAEQADRAEAASTAGLAELRARLGATLDAGLPTAADHEFAARCAAEGLPAAFEEFQRARGQQREAASRRATLQDTHRQLVDRSRRLRQDAETALIDEASIVATTLARSRLHPALASARFDVVLVDEAGAGALVEVMLALCRATTTAVLFGDFLQLPPIQDSTIQRCDHPALRRWVLPSPFAHVGIRTPTEAVDHPGCVPLLHQFRFGPSLRRLANDVIYEVLRDASELPGILARADTEIVFVDTSGLGELAEVRRTAGKRGWWPAGLVLARALAEHHLPQDQEVGIITPYGAQRDALLAGLRDRDVITGVPVGTVHAFQGREFPTVVFDLVEDGEGWIAGARRDAGSYAEDGVRLFGVGITRARHRLYLVGDIGAVRRAARGPLAAVRRAGREDRIRVWSGAELLGIAAPPRFVDSAFTQVSETLRQLVSVTDVTDEKTFYAELARALRAANRRIWMWSPWISTRAEQVVPLIADAVARGVRVGVFLRPDDDRNMAKDWAQRQLPALLGSGATVIRSDHEHRKIVVIDELTVLFGSLNALSNSGNSSTRESMLTLTGGEFAHRLLDELRVRELGTPHPCAGCGQVCQVKRAGGRSTGWSWFCASCRRREPVPEPARRGRGDGA